VTNVPAAPAATSPAVRRTMQGNRKVDSGPEQRDRATDHLLAAEGWSVLRFWEHEDASLVGDAIE